MKTFTAKKNTVKRNWYIINAENKILGRLASKLAQILRGKHKSEYTPHVDTGDYIIILNAKKVIVSGDKYNSKIYYHYTGYVGGIKKINFKEMIAKHPERIIEKAVKGMMPKGTLGRTMLRKLKVYSGEQHNHVAQQPKKIDI